MRQCSNYTENYVTKGFKQSNYKHYSCSLVSLGYWFLHFLQIQKYSIIPYECPSLYFIAFTLVLGIEPRDSHILSYNTAPYMKLNLKNFVKPSGLFKQPTQCKCYKNSYYTTFYIWIPLLNFSICGCNRTCKYRESTHFLKSSLVPDYSLPRVESP